jgi:hypothetical protein
MRSEAEKAEAWQRYEKAKRHEGAGGLNLIVAKAAFERGWDEHQQQQSREATIVAQAEAIRLLYAAASEALEPCTLAADVLKYADDRARMRTAATKLRAALAATAPKEPSDADQQ